MLNNSKHGIFLKQNKNRDVTTVMNCDQYLLLLQLGSDSNKEQNMLGTFI
jgi:hypothetical protein